MKDQYVAIKDIISGTVHFKHPFIPIGTVCEVTRYKGEFIITYNGHKICAVDSNMAQEYFILISH